MQFVAFGSRPNGDGIDIIQYELPMHWAIDGIHGVGSGVWYICYS